MPSGYTANVADGTITSLRDFALICARGMGALITMRDEPFGAPIPEKLEPHLAFYGPELAKAQALLAELPTLSDAECDARAQAEFDHETESRRECAERERQQLSRYDAMIAQVEAWDCKAEGLKRFMLEQLRESRAFDCPAFSDVPALTRLTESEWREKATVDAARAVASLSEQVANEHERTAARNAWLAALRESLR